MAKDEKYWLVKTEPDSFSIDDLAKSPGKKTCWSGVRNYQARNYMRDEMKVGHRVLFYHSSTVPPAVMGTAKVVREGYPDHTAFDPDDSHYDSASKLDAPRWYMVDIKLERKFEQPLTLEELRDVAALKNMVLLQRGSRLSVQPVTKVEFETVLKLADEK